MNFDQAIKIVQQYQQDCALPGLLEAMQQMKESFEDLFDQERRAYLVVFREMGKLFAPA